MSRTSRSVTIRVVAATVLLMGLLSTASPVGAVDDPGCGTFTFVNNLAFSVKVREKVSGRYKTRQILPAGGSTTIDVGSNEQWAVLEAGVKYWKSGACQKWREFTVQIGNPAGFVPYEEGSVPPSCFVDSQFKNGDVARFDVTIVGDEQNVNIRGSNRWLARRGANPINGAKFGTIVPDTMIVRHSAFSGTYACDSDWLDRDFERENHLKWGRNDPGSRSTSSVLATYGTGVLFGSRFLQGTPSRGLYSGPFLLDRTSGEISPLPVDPEVEGVSLDSVHCRGRLLVLAVSTAGATYQTVLDMKTGKHQGLIDVSESLTIDCELATVSWDGLFPSSFDLKNLT